MALDSSTSAASDQRARTLEQPEPEAPPPPAASLAAIGGARKRSNLGKRLLLVALVLTGLGVIAFAMMPRPVAVESALVTRAAMRVTVDEDGVARIEDRYVVSAPMSGRLERIEAKAGDQVQRG